MMRFKKFMCTWASLCMVLQPVMVQAQDNTLRVPLGNVQTGAEGGGQLTYSDSELSFGDVFVLADDARKVTIQNSGSASVSFSKIEVTGTNFSRNATTCGEYIAPQASCDVFVRFAPTSSGTKTGSLVIESDDTEPTHTIAITGRGKAGTLSAEGYTFPQPRQVNDEMVFRDVTVSNPSTSPVVVSHVSVSVGVSDFNQSNDCLRTLGPGQTCVVRVSFRPTEAGTRSGVVSVLSDSDESPLNFSVQGDGRNPAGTLTAASFGSVQVGDTIGRSMTVTNTGVGPLTVQDKAVTGADYQKPATGEDTCTEPVSVGGTCSFLVNFTPTATGSRAGTVSVQTDAGSLSQPFDGIGAGQSATLSNVEFGNRDAGGNYAMTSTLTNTGLGALSVTAPTAASVTGTGFTFGATDCPASLPKGGSCLVTVQYAPTTAADNTGSLKVTTGGGQLTAALSGTGEQAILAFNPTAIPSFGDVQVGLVVASASVTLTNSGNVPASNLSFTPPTGYSLSGSTCSTTLAPGGNCSFKVQFAPTEVKAYAGNLTVTAAAPVKATELAVSGQGAAQAATLSSIAFGSRTANSNTTMTSTLDNTGVGPLSITVPTASSVSGTGFSFVSTTCPTSLASGTSCTVSVRYTPTNGDAYNGTLTVTTGAGVKSAALTGQGLQGVAETSPSSVTFPATQVGQSRAQTVTLSNTGNTPLVVSAISIPTGGADYKQTNTCSTIAAGNSCVITVTFTPTTTGSLPGTVAIAHDGTGASAVTLTGVGQAQSATLSTPTFSTSTPVGSSSTAQATLTNTGVGPLAVTVPTAASVSGTDFSFVSTTCGTSVAVSSSCSVTVRFSPTSTSPRTGVLTVATGAGSKTANLSATAIQGYATITPTSLTFSDQQTATTSASQTVTVRNTGTNTLVISKVETTAGSDFAQTNTCGTLAVNATCTVSVTFTPTATGTRGSTLTFTHNGAGGTTASLTGTGRAPSVILAAPSFSNTQVGSNTLGTATLTNDGVGTVSVTAPVAGSVTGADFQFVSTSCGGSLAAGNSCTTSIRFTPSAAGVRSGTFSIATSAGNPSATLTATGLQGNVSVPSTSVTFPAKQVGDAVTQSVTVTNNGNTTLTFSEVKVATGAADYTLTHTCTTVAVNGTCKIDVTFNPSGTGTRAGSVSMAHNGTGPSTLTLSGTGQAQAATLSTPTFPATPVGSSSTATATLTNTGIGNLSVTVPSSASVTGTDFSFVSTTCGTSLAPNGTCSVTVQFTSTSTTARAGTLTVNTGAGARAVSLGSTGIQGYASISPGSLSFAPQQNNTTAPVQTVTVTNTGTHTLTFTGVDVSVGKPEFQQTNNCASVPVNGTCAVSVNFTPSQAGARSGTLSFVHDGGGMAHVSLSGTGQAPSGTLSTPSFPTTGVGASNTATATVTNTGIGTLSLAAPTVSGTDFALASTTCGTVLTTNSSCTITVRFSPTSTAARSGTVSIGTGAGTLSAPLNATGVQGAATLSPNGLTFAGQTIGSTSGSQAVTVTNSGTAALTISAVGVSTGATDFGASNGCGGASGQLAPGNSCTVSVSFTPQAAGARPGTLTVTHNGTNGSTSIALQGTGVAAATVSNAVFSPTTVTAGSGSTFTWATTGASSASVACSGVASGSGSGTSGSFNVATSGVGTGTCQVTAYNSAGTAATRSANLSVVAAPSAATASFAKTTLTAGSSTTFSWTTSNATSASVSCSGVAAGSGSGLNGSITVTTSGVGSGTCQVTASNAAGTTSTRSASLTTVAAPSVTAASFSPSTVTSGSASTFTWNTSNATSASVSCAGTAVGSASGTSGSLSVGTTGTGSGWCTVTATNAAGDSASNTGYVNVVAAARVTGISFSPTSVNSGGSSTLSWSTSGATSASVSCAAPAYGSSTALNGSITVTTSGSGTGRCTVSVSNGAGSSDSAGVNLTVIVPPPTVTSASFATTALTNGDSTTFSWNTSGATSASVSCGGIAVGSGSGTSGSISVRANGTGSGSCTVTASNAGGNASGSASFTSYAAPTASSYFGSGTVGAGVSNRYYWSTANATSASVSCWGVASGSSSALNSNIAVSTSGAGTGYCSVTAYNAAGRSTSSQSSYSAINKPTASSSFDATTLTKGQSTTFRWSTSGASISTNVDCWGAASGSYRGSAASGSITVTAISTGNGACNVAAINQAGQTDATSTFYANPLPNPSVNSAGFSQSSVTSGSYGTFSWSTSNAVSASVSCSGAGWGSGNGTSGSISVGTSGSGTVTCTVTAYNADNASASRSGSMTVTMPAPPYLNVNVNMEQNVQEDYFDYTCYGQSYESGPYPYFSDSVVIGGCRSDFYSCNYDYNAQYKNLVKQCEAIMRDRRGF